MVCLAVFGKATHPIDKAGFFPFSLSDFCFYCTSNWWDVLPWLNHCTCPLCKPGGSPFPSTDIPTFFCIYMHVQIHIGATRYHNTHRITLNTLFFLKLAFSPNDVSMHFQMGTCTNNSSLFTNCIATRLFHSGAAPCLTLPCPVDGHS